MIKSYKYRIYPKSSQKILIDKTIGVCRFVYNLALETKIRVYKDAGINLSSNDLQKQLTELKKDFKWICEVDSQAVINSVKNVGISFDKFFNEKCGFPKFKKKMEAGSFVCPNNLRRIDWTKGVLDVPKIYGIPIRLHREFNGKIRLVIISRTANGKYFASIIVKTDEPDIIKSNVMADTSVGIDVGIKDLAITSDGRIFESNRPFKNSLKRLKCLQRRASRKKKGSNNNKKANKCVATLNEKIINQRTDYIHKVTYALTHDNQVGSIFIENLNIVGLLKNRNLSKAFSDVSIGEFYRQLEYKCEWYGVNLVKIGRFDPSSKRCSDCGKINQGLTLSDREWACPCGSLHQRDFNAAKNIKWFGLNNSPEGIRGGPVESSAIVEAEKQESFSIMLIPQQEAFV